MNGYVIIDEGSVGNDSSLLFYSSTLGWGPYTKADRHKGKKLNPISVTSMVISTEVAEKVISK